MMASEEIGFGPSEEQSRHLDGFEQFNQYMPGKRTDGYHCDEYFLEEADSH
jgi:hypothetical protein